MHVTSIFLIIRSYIWVDLFLVDGISLFGSVLLTLPEVARFSVRDACIVLIMRPHILFRRFGFLLTCLLFGFGLSLQSAVKKSGKAVIPHTPQ